jgi:hypothetical protein
MEGQFSRVNKKPADDLFSRSSDRTKELRKQAVKAKRQQDRAAYMKRRMNSPEDFRP